MNAATTPSHDNDIPVEVDFTGATRGKFYRPNLRLNLPVYLDAEVQDYQNVNAAKKEASAAGVAERMAFYWKNEERDCVAQINRRATKH